MNRLTIIVGAGGTGSYAFPNLVHLLSTDTNTENDIVLIDGDRVEEKNLLRQGFLQKDLDQNKAEVLVKRYSKAYPHLGIWYSNQYVNDVNCLQGVVNVFPKVDEVVFISCVDNNYARLRLFLAQCELFKEKQIPSYFIDAGNGEWFGQVITSKVTAEKVQPLSTVGNRMVVSDSPVNDLSHINNIFVKMNDWRQRLTRGDHELSCDEVTVSHPQNIGTNMMSASLIIKALTEVLQRGIPSEYRFNSRTNRFTIETAPTTEQIMERLVDITDFVNTTEDIVFGDTLIPIFPASQDVQERFRVAREQLESQAQSQTWTQEAEDLGLDEMFDMFADDGEKETPKAQDGGIVDLDGILEETLNEMTNGEDELEDWLADFVI
ncbi:ThiF family adenylyltransferase [Bacillus thuringiensis]|uniref:ThiF family adenylyltransferase n=1 Tax=Bacillus thuringiensis TaxID=1428 RepID=UPI000BFDA081|nr:ThiF family adenylyltransferase [Bacillus thuringiensis]PGT89994.1 hypothetical protein COD17_09600 [Bacillus thuringiensis]